MKHLSGFWYHARASFGSARGLLSIALIAGAGSSCTDRATKFTGIWKADCKDYWGVQIQPAGGGLYSVTFCGLSGCLKPGEWTPNTRIEGDPMYQVVSDTTLRIKRNDRGDFTYARCSSDPAWQVSQPR